MTLMRDLVTKIARKIGIVQAGQEPVGADADDLLDALNDVIGSLPLLRDGEWCDVLLTSSAPYTASDGERIALEGFDPIITLPTTYIDDCGKTRIQRDLSRAHVIGDGIYIWSSTKAAWGKVDGLGLTDTLPFGQEDEAGLVALTVMLVGDEYGSAPSQVTVALAQSAVRDFEARFYREVPVRADLAFLRMSNTGFCSGFS